MGDPSMWKPILGTLASIVGAWLVYRGVKLTADRANEGVSRTSDVTAQESALKAWEGLLEPYRQEVATLRQELREERDDRAREAKTDRDEVERLRDQVDNLTSEVRTWKRVAQTIARWATALRDEVLRLGGTVPATPEELLTLQALDERYSD